MLLGIVLGLLILGLIFLYVLDKDRKAAPVFVLAVFMLMITSVIVGYKGPKDHEVKKQIKPSIKVIIENGKSDTTYIYKFEEEK